MNKFRPLLLLLPLLILASCGSKDPKSASFVVAQGKNVKITRGELDKEKETQLKGIGIPLDKLPAEQLANIETQILNTIVNRKIILAAAASLKDPTISKQADERIAQIASKFPSPEVFAEKLKENNMTSVTLKKEFEDQILAEKFIDSKVNKEAVSASPADVEKFYKDHPEYWKAPETVRIRQITVKVAADASKEDTAAKKKAIDAARTRIAKGEKFEVVSGEISEDPFKAQGGSYPKFGKGQAPAEIESAAFSQKVNVLGPVFKSPAGFHFMEVLERNAAHTQTLDEVGGQISSHLSKSKYSEAVDALIQDLRTKADVKINLPKPVESKSSELAPAAEKAAPAAAPAAPAKK